MNIHNVFSCTVKGGKTLLVAPPKHRKLVSGWKDTAAEKGSRLARRRTPFLLVSFPPSCLSSVVPSFLPPFRLTVFQVQNISLRSSTVPLQPLCLLSVLCCFFPTSYILKMSFKYFHIQLSVYLLYTELEKLVCKINNAFELLGSKAQTFVLCRTSCWQKCGGPHAQWEGHGFESKWVKDDGGCQGSFDCNQGCLSVWILVLCWMITL